ncbi:hypothetical protein O181_098288 [Austropuccinia psidii MF-1]|uniref:Uncharacterized protein n=1 Tax=Austropuccinia psidii MF-1 TaxID=1389203 RepID=A0A9Q3PE02_9BASI|nr:hypothetical protein [Austropuccinia psidii MF-1]
MTTLLGDWVTIYGNKEDFSELDNSINCNTQPEPHCSSASREHFPSQLQHSLRLRCRALYAPSGVSPAFVPRQQQTLVMLADKHTRNVCLLSAPSNHEARGVLAQDALARTPLWSTMMKPSPSANGHRDLNHGGRNDSGRLALSPQALICPPPLLGHRPMVTSLLDLSEVIIWPMKDGDGKRTF